MATCPVLQPSLSWPLLSPQCIRRMLKLSDQLMAHLPSTLHKLEMQLNRMPVQVQLTTAKPPAPDHRATVLGDDPRAGNATPKRISATEIAEIYSVSNACASSHPTARGSGTRCNGSETTFVSTRIIRYQLVWAVRDRDE